MQQQWKRSISSSLTVAVLVLVPIVAISFLGGTSLFGTGSGDDPGAPSLNYSLWNQISETHTPVKATGTAAPSGQEVDVMLQDWQYTGRPITR